MPHPSPITWILSAVALLLIALCAAAAYATLRRPARTRIAQWSATRLVGLCALAALPWLVVWLRVNHFSVNVDGIGQFIGWLLVALLLFALLVLLPLVVILAVIVWTTARMKR